MTAKPDFGDSGTILRGDAGASVVAGLVYWRHRAATNVAPGRSAADA